MKTLTEIYKELELNSLKSKEKTIINKELRLTWRALYPFGTIPKSIEKVLEEVKSFISKFEENNYPEHWEQNKEYFLEKAKETSELIRIMNEK